MIEREEQLLMPNSYRPKKFYNQNAVTKQSVTTQNKVDQSNNQQSPSSYTSLPPFPMQPYSRRTLSILFFGCVVAVICFCIPGWEQNIAMSLVIGMLVSVLILDWKGFSTLNGHIKWKKIQKNHFWLLAAVFFGFFPFLLIFYIVSNAIKMIGEIKTYQPELPSPKNRSNVACTTGIAVVLLSLLTAFTSRNTNTVMPQQAQISTQAQSVPLQNAPSVQNSVSKPTSASRQITQPTSKSLSTTSAQPVQEPGQQAKNPQSQLSHHPIQQPQPVQPPQRPVGVNGNPWGYNFDAGTLIYNPLANFCTYFTCITSFWKSTNGYVDECNDGMFSHSGGVSGACSRHGGEMRPLYSH
jgi:hypothetical protein